MIAKRLIGTLGNGLLAVLAAYVLAVLFASQSVVGRLAGLGIELTLAERVRMYLQDLVGMAGSLLGLIAAGFVIALLVAGLLGRRLRPARTALFTLAGACALLGLHLALEAAFDIVPVAVARTPLGLGSQALAGAAGGWLFARLQRRAAERRAP